MAKNSYFFTSESVTEGHPDKMCDKISDSLLDAYLAQDPYTRFACDTEVKSIFGKDGELKHFVFLGGEITSNAKVDIEDVVRKTIKEIGYDEDTKGFNYKNCRIIQCITSQSPDIAQGVNASEKKEMGAGDQGIMFGYACNETKELMPLSLMLAHRLAHRLAYVRKDPKTKVPFLWPDGKSQVTVEYQNGKPKRLADIVIAAQHDDVDVEVVRAAVMKYVVLPVCRELMDDETIVHINATGKFHIGGPLGDSGVTGRKIVVDTYGGHAPHGGGAFSGKDPTKVDRSAAYAARYIAKNIVKAGLASECLVQLAYCIGIAEPRSIRIVLDGKTKDANARLVKVVRDIFPVKPADIIDYFNMRQPMYAELAAYGHFGRENFPWEKTDKVAELLKKLK